MSDPSVASLVDYLYEVAGEIEASPCLPSGKGVLLPTTRERLMTLPIRLREAASRLSSPEKRKQEWPVVCDRCNCNVYCDNCDRSCL